MEKGRPERTKGWFQVTCRILPGSPFQASPEVTPLVFPGGLLRSMRQAAFLWALTWPDPEKLTAELSQADPLPVPNTQHGRQGLPHPHQGNRLTSTPGTPPEHPCPQLRPIAKDTEPKKTVSCLCEHACN